MNDKTLHNSDVSGARANVPDIKVVGNGDSFRLLCKASSHAEGWMKSTKAMEIPGVGCVVQVTTQQKNRDDTYSVAEAVTFVPGVKIVDDINHGRKLASWHDQSVTDPEVVRLLGEIRQQNIHILEGVTMAIEAIQRIQTDVARISVDIDQIKQKIVDIANNADASTEAALSPLADSLDAATTALDQVAGPAAVALAEGGSTTNTDSAGNAV